MNEPIRLSYALRIPFHLIISLSRLEDLDYTAKFNTCFGFTLSVSIFCENYAGHFEKNRLLEYILKPDPD